MRHPDEETSLEQLARLAGSGDPVAIDALLRRIRPTVLSRCAALLPHRADAEEACQDVLLKVATGIGGFEHRARFTTWLYPIVTNCVRQTYRSLRRRAGEHAEPAPLADVPDPRRTSVIAGARVAVLDAVERLERRRPNTVAPFLLRDLADLEYSEIAARLGLSEATLKFRIHEARTFVRRHLTESASLRTRD